MLPLLFALFPFPLIQATQYQLSKSYAGQTFFNDWVYYNNFDNMTNGDAIFVSKEVGMSSGLTTVNSAGNAVIKVDNTTRSLFNVKRNTVRISTPEAYGVGTLWMADFLHVPFGCSVWPAWWSQAPGWPTSNGGEINTFEGVNLQTNNQISLHTNPGCMLTQSANSSMSGKVISTNCAFDANGNQGCIVTDTRTQSFGEAFAQAGGGVFVTELAKSGVSIWFYPRVNVPSSLNGDIQTLDSTTLGQPVATYSTTDCDIDTFFAPQNLILDITLCGDFAGSPAIFNQTCQGICYDDFVIGPPSGYDNAYFEIKSIKTFADLTVVKVNSSQGDNTGGSQPSPSSGSGSLPTRPKSAGVIAGGVIGLLVCLALVGGFIFCFFRRSRAARVEGYADGYEISRPTEENNMPEYLTGGPREDRLVNLEKGLRNMTDISIPSLLGVNGSSFPASTSLLPLSDGQPPIPATELGAPEAYRLAVVSGPIGAPPPGESTELTAVEDNGDKRVPEEILQELHMLREEVQRFRTGGPTAEWLNGLPNNIPPPEYASSPDPEMRLWQMNTF